MCIICAKPSGIAMPTEEVIRNMWFGNPDGAGFMYADAGKVHIEKGFMSLDALTDRLDSLAKEINLTEHSLVLHFRIKTHGTVSPDNTHPFPVSDNIGILKKLRTSAKIGVAHNGIIDIMPRTKDISDTMEYIASQMAPLSRFCPEFYKNKDALLMIKNAISSKMAIMDRDGNLYLIGDFQEDAGISYSNGSYKSYLSLYRGGQYRVYGCGYDNWGDDEDWEDAILRKYGKENAKPASELDDLAASGKTVEYSGLMCRVKNLMSVGDANGYVKSGGYVTDGEDYYLDADNNVYMYDYEYDVYIPDDSATAFSDNGLVLRFSDKDTYYGYCVLWD